MVKVKYVGPFDEIDVVGQTVKRNHQFEVDADVAGHPPVPRWAEAQAELIDAVTGHPDHERAAKLRDELAGLDMGEGLLAQTENFQPVTAGKTKDGDK